ncbi:hypothetical protein AAFF_G00134310 [Aldrovandia affinis]|uniref:Ig-like domain-containing protein n=1 Tax=Aldrovandia affinis TaxID=143900 RepID=A0AAD7RQJ3_9TELE|nr:hypothetical protein AAFF_G00134310 [Aldrovandia affinis]
MSYKLVEMVLIVDGTPVILLLLLHAGLGIYLTTKGPMSTKPLFTEFRSETYDLGSSVDLICTNKTWDEMVYTIWKLNMNGIQCTIASGFDVQYVDSCTDGKVLNDSRSGGSRLHIPEFSNGDEGVYHCEAVHIDGIYVAEIQVSTAVPPQISTRLVFRDGKREAVCSAAGGKPAASVSWRSTWNYNVTLSSTQNSDGSFTMESRMILPETVSADNLICIVTHLSWRREHIMRVPPAPTSAAISTLQYSILSICSVILLSGFLAACLIVRTSVRRWSNKVRRPICHVYR